MYEGVSITDYLKSIGQPSDYASRATLAASKGITGYVGSAQQNTQLLNILRGGGAPAPSPQPPQAPGAPAQPTATQATQQPAQTGQPQTAQDLVNMGFYGYQGWGNVEAIADYKATGGAGKGGPTTGAGAGAGAGVDTSFFTQPTINLPELYEGLYATSGISEIESKLSSMTTSYNEAVAKIKDNPYLSEATMVGRLSKLADKFNADTLAVRGEIATKKADIETKLNIQMKQFDINSQQATQALNQFQVLLQSGALNNATGEDIANITRATGISSSMIYSAIQAMKKKDVQTSVITWDDGTNQGFAVINTQTGEIIKTDTVAQSEPKAASVASTKEADKQQTQQNAIADIQAGSILRDIVGHYVVAGGLSVEEVYRLYNSYSPYGAAEEDIEDVKEGKFIS